MSSGVYYNDIISDHFPVFPVDNECEIESQNRIIKKKRISEPWTSLWAISEFFKEIFLKAEELVMNNQNRYDWKYQIPWCYNWPIFIFSVSHYISYYI